MHKDEWVSLDGSQIRVVPFPEAQDCGNGRWRVRRHVETEPGWYARSLELPAPRDAFEGLTFVITVLTRKPGHITIVLLTLYRGVIGEGVAYASTLMQAIRRESKHVTIDGCEDHPILMMGPAPAGSN
jgi:hypothetical protein